MLIEFFDELNYGVGNAALPAIRTDLGLSYVQVGLLLGLPTILNTLIEPVLMLLGDTRFRKHIMLGGGLMIAFSLVIIAGTSSFLLVLMGMVISFSASGAFVSLSQATLMDLNPGREPQMMARWTVAGSIRPRARQVAPPGAPVSSSNIATCLQKIDLEVGFVCNPCATRINQVD
jgi:FSR family fosmidomycin resistance protein-like MFS transporter